MTLKTFSFSTLILFASCLAFLQAQDCNNPLLQTFELTGLPNPESGASLPYCSNLQSGETCCNNDTVSSFQTMINNLTTSLQNAAAARDRYILALQNQFSQQYQDAAGNLSALSDQISAIQTANPGIGNRISAQRYQIGNISAALTEANNNFQADFQSYQSARQTCFDTVLKVQASAWCLACDPNYASLGVRENGTIAFSSNLCTKITQACFPFLSAAVKENALFNAQQSSERLQNLIAYIANITANNGTIPDTPLQGDILRSTNATERTVSIPGGCTDAGTCAWQCQNLFSGEGVLNQTVAANGAGQIGGDDVNFDPIGEAAANTRRMRLLQGGSAWDPNIDGTNLAIVVVPDPANVASAVADGSGITIIPISGRRFGAGSVMVGLLIFIVEIMLF